MWTLFIVFSWPFLALGATIFGLLNFRSLAGKLAAAGAFSFMLVSMVIMPMFFLKQSLQETANLQNKAKTRDQVEKVITAVKDTTINVIIEDLLSKAETKAESITQSDKKSEITADLVTISQEIKTNQLTTEQEGNYLRMVGYLIGIMDRGLTDVDYKDWQGIFANRKELKRDYMSKFLVSKGFTDTAVPTVTPALNHPAQIVPGTSGTPANAPPVTVSQSSSFPEAPTLTNPANGSIFSLNPSTVDVRGFGLPGAGITIIDGSVTLIEAGKSATRGDFIVDQNGNFRGILLFKSGSHSLSAMQVINGRTSSPSNTVNFVVQAK